MKRVIPLIFFTLTLISNNSFAEFKQAPEINLPGLDGNIQLENLKGKVIYLDFWASWCLPCKESFPWMNQMKQAYADQGFEIVAINLDEERKLADEFLKEVDVNFKVAFDKSGQTPSQYKVKGMPSSYLIGRDGKIYASHTGFREKDKQKLEQAIASLLNK
jgi:cytochrome c biogenesis protein CcmG/thiol:disulfide interchange protein DsbE